MPCRQSLSEEFIERRVKEREEGKRNTGRKRKKRQGPDYLFRRVARREGGNLK